MLTHNGVAVYIPRQEEIEKIVKSVDITPAKCFLDLVAHRQIHGFADDAGYVRLKSQYLQNQFGMNYKRFETKLWTRGIVEKHEFYRKGNYSFGYRLPSELLHSRRETIDDPKQAQRRQTEKTQQEKRLQPVHRHLMGSLSLVEPNKQEATRLLTENSRDRNHRILLREPIKRLLHNDLFGTVDDMGRFHTNLSGIKKEMRAAMRLNGQKLIAIDMACAQPTLLGWLASHYFKNKHTAFRFRNRQFDTNSHPYKNRKLQPFNKNHNYPEIDHWMKLCRATKKENDVYSFLADGKITREQAKKEFMFWAYGQVRIRKTPIHKHFPKIGQVLDEIKATDHTYSACLLQNLESTLFLGTIVDELKKTNPEMPILSIHDCLCTTPNYADDLLKMMRSEFEKIGLFPVLRKE